MVIIDAIILLVAAKASMNNASMNNKGGNNDGWSCFLDELGNHVYYDRRLHLYYDRRRENKRQVTSR